MNSLLRIRVLLAAALVCNAILVLNFSGISMEATPLADAGLLGVFVVETLLILISIYFTIRKNPIARTSWLYAAVVAMVFIASTAFLPPKI